MLKKKILIIGAGWEQIPLIEKAKELGLKTITTHPNQQGEGLAYANHYEIADPRDLPKILEIARKYQIDAVTADECDYSYYASVFVANVLGLPGSPIDKTQWVSNKKRMRLKCRKYAVLQPEFYPCSTLAEVKKAIRKLNFPVIIKPLDNRGNFGVNQVIEDTEIPAAFYEALANSHSREVLVERFIEGTMLMIDGFVFDNVGHVPLAISSKKLLGGQKRIAMDIIYPAQVAKKLIKKTFEISNYLANQALKLEKGATHIEFIVDKQEDIYLIEIHNRGGGVYISNKIVKAISGIDVSTSLIRQALGEAVTIEKQPNILEKYALLKFFRFPPGTIKQILYLEKTKKIPGLIALRLAVKEGDTIKEITADANRHGFTITVGNSSKEVYQSSKQALNNIKIIYEPSPSHQ